MPWPKADADHLIVSSLQMKGIESQLFEGPGEILTVKGDYGQIRWRRPVPDVWLRVDQLEVWQAK